MYLIVGILIGFVAAIPIGPINVYAISQTLKRDLIHGLLVGITSAILDVVFCLTVLTGMQQILTQLQAMTLHFKGLGSLILVIIAVRLIFQARHDGVKNELDEESSITHHKPVITTILMYITNPSLYAFWIGVGSTITAHSIVMRNGFDPLGFSLACGLGTTLWYVALVRYVWKRHHKLSASTIRKLLYITAVVLIGLAGYLLVASCR
jgi:L-lysine exporter family protein LysE/ArgO